MTVAELQFFESVPKLLTGIMNELKEMNKIQKEAVEKSLASFNSAESDADKH